MKNVKVWMESKLWIYLSDQMENETLAVGKAIYFLSSSQASKQHSKICFHTAGNPLHGLNTWDQYELKDDSQNKLNSLFSLQM